MKLLGKIIFCVIAISLHLVSFCNSNQQLDSLKSLLQNENDKSEQVKILLKIGQQLEENEPDTALKFYNNARTILKINPNVPLLAQTELRLANAFEIKGSLDSSMFYYQEALAYFKKVRDHRSVGSCYNGMGNVAYYKYDLANSIKYYKKSLEAFENLSNQENNIATEMHNIGLVQSDIGELTKALVYYRNSLKVFIKLKNNYMAAICYNSIASVYLDRDQNDSAIYYFKLSLKYNMDKNDINTEVIYSNLGQVYMKKKEYQTALEYYVKAETIAIKTNDEIGLANIYEGFGHLFFNRSEYQKGIGYLKKAEKYAKKTQSNEFLEQTYQLLRKSYAKTNDYKNAYNYTNLLVVLRDSLYTVEKVKAVAKTEAIYQNKQRELVIENLEKENSLSKEKAKKQRLFLIAVIAGFLGVTVFLIFIVRLLRRNQRTNKLLYNKNVEILAQRDEIEAQRDLVVAQKEKIETFNKEISQSIDYAKRIQMSILPFEDKLNKFVSDYFIFYKPRDIVSGDFFWWKKMELDNVLIIAVSDCTGHGVPGAFMSMLGISFLREIVTKEYVLHPGVILRKLRKEVINVLKQKDEFGTQKDGMDMSLISINLETNELQYAGANNPIYIVTRNKINISSEESNNTKDQSLHRELAKNDNDKLRLIEIKPDKMPIGIYDKMDKFSNKKLQLGKGDLIYLFSDGYADQFGGTENKKFKYKAFKNLLLKNADKPMNEQEKLLESTYHNWKKENDQVDDITILGIKL